MIEILGGDGLSNAILDLSVNAKNTYKGKTYEVWELSEEDLLKLDSVPAGQWKDEWGWWRRCSGCNITHYPRHTFKVNGRDMIGWYDEYKLDDFLTYIESYDDEYDSIEDVKEEFFSIEYKNLTDYLCRVFDATSWKNIAAISIDLAKLNNMSLGELFRIYQRETKELQITFDEFKRHIEAIERAECLQIDINRVTREYTKYGPGEVTLHLPSLADNIIDLLEILTQDENEWISYYIYDLDFGQKYHEGRVKDENGNAIPLATIEDLWDILTNDALYKAIQIG